MSKKAKAKAAANYYKPYHKPLIRRRKPNRSVGGDVGLYIFLALMAIVMVFPLVYAIANALKPLDELFRFPPKIFAQNPTLDNFSDLFVDFYGSHRESFVCAPAVDLKGMRFLHREMAFHV